MEAAQYYVALGAREKEFKKKWRVVVQEIQP